MKEERKRIQQENVEKKEKQKETEKKQQEKVFTLLRDFLRSVANAFKSLLLDVPVGISGRTWAI